MADIALVSSKQVSFRYATELDPEVRVDERRGLGVSYGQRSVGIFRHVVQEQQQRHQRARKGSANICHLEGGR